MIKPWLIFVRVVMSTCFFVEEIIEAVSSIPKGGQKCKIDIYVYAFSRRFYPKRLTVHSGYTCFITMCVPWESNPQPVALLMQCSTTEPQEHRKIKWIFELNVWSIDY